MKILIISNFLKTYHKIKTVNFRIFEVVNFDPNYSETTMEYADS